MESLSEVNLAEFREAMDSASIKMIQIIFAALACGVLVFTFVVIIFIYNFNPPDNNESTTLVINLMTMFNFIFIVASIITSKVIYKHQFSDKNLKIALNRDYKVSFGNIFNQSPAQKCIALIRTASILRLAPLEGSAFFGLVTTLIAVQSGAGMHHPIFYINMISILPFLFFIAVNFPTVEKLEIIFQSNIQKVL